MTIGSLFAGIGAFDLGFQQAAFETLWQVEIDRHCQRLLKGKFPWVKRTLDVRRFNPDKWIALRMKKVVDAASAKA